MNVSVIEYYRDKETSFCMKTVETEQKSEVSSQTQVSVLETVQDPTSVDTCDREDESLSNQKIFSSSFHTFL